MWIFVFLLVVSSRQLSQIQVNTQISGVLAINQTAFYQVSIPQKLEANSVLIATVDVVEDHIAPEIYLSSTTKYPDYFSSDQSCLAEKIGSCAKGNLIPGTPMYISVTCVSACSYTIFVDLEPTIDISINTRYNLSFESSSSGVLTFTLDQQYDEFRIFTEDLDFYASNHYRLLLGKGFIPSQNNYTLACIDIGPFRKALKLTKNQIETNIIYYLLVEAEQNTQFLLDSQAYLQGQQGFISPNSTIFDYLDDDRTYTISYILSSESVKQPLYIRLKTYSGYGAISVTHCGMHNFMYWDNMGENQQIRISPKERQACLDTLTGLQIQNTEIQVLPFYNTYSFSIGSRQSSYSSEVRFAQYESGTLGAGQSSNFTLSLLLTEPTNISLNIWIQQGEATFSINSCENDTCNLITVIEDQGNVQIPYDPKSCSGRCYLLLNVLSGFKDSQFGFIYRASGYRMKLDQDSVDVGFIAMNQYIYYNLTLTNSSNVSSIVVKALEYSGSINLIASRTLTNPSLSDALFSDEAITNWDNTITFTQNLSSPIYVSVLGQSESIYKITVMVDRFQNTPAIYTRLQDQVSNNFVSSDEPILVRYTPSVNPYYLSFYPLTPSCISYGSTLPLEQKCMELPDGFSGQLYMNITGIVGQSLKITISSDVYSLSSANPLFLNCDEICVQTIEVQIDNGSIGVMHSGYGRIFNKQTNQTVNNGLLTLTCPDKQSKCTATIFAELVWGQMIVSVSSDEITEISWYPQPVSLKLLPKKMVYKLPKNVPSVITIVSKIASVDLYANIEMLDKQRTNHLALNYPNRSSYDFKVESDPFKRTLSLEISQTLQQDLGCFSDNQYCLLTITIFLNNHCRYVHFVQDEILLVSASSYTMKLSENTRYLMEDISELEYYEYQNSLPSNFTFMIEPVSNCKPLLVFSNQTDYPTDQYNTQQSYHSISIINSTRAIVGVVSDTDCLYNIIVSIDDISSNYRVLVEGFPQTIQIPKNSTVYLYYQSPTKLPFQISGTVSNIPVYVLEVPEGKNPSDYLPKKGFSDYSAPHLPLTINSSKPSSYMIALVNSLGKNISTSLLLTQSGLEVLMVHNRIYQQSTEENGTYLFRYYSANSFKVVFVTSSGTLDVNIQGGYVIIDKTISDSSTQSTIDVTADGDLRPYWISITSQSIGYFSIQIIDIGGEASPSLSSGLPFFDAFTQNPQTNCYQFKGDPTHTEPIRVSIIYKQQFIKSLESNNKSLKSLDLRFSYSFKSYSSDAKESISLRNYNYFAQGITFSLEQAYGLYNFCFENVAEELLDSSYFVVVASKDLQFLIPSISFFISDSVAQLDKYELISTQPKTILAELMNCQGQTQLTATSNYTEILDGMTTEIHNDFKNGPYFAGLVNVSKGYYYLGAKAVKPNSSYIIRFTNYDQTQKIVLSQMSLGNINMKWHGQNDHLTVTAESLRCLNTCNFTKFIRYYLYVGKSIDSINRRTRCGIQDSQNLVKVYEIISTNVSHQSVKFKIPFHELPSSFALSLRAQAVQTPKDSDPRSVYYFYNTTSMLKTSDVPFEDDWLSWEAMVLTMIIMSLVLIFFILFICKRFKIGIFRNSRSLQFQVTNFTSNTSREPEPAEGDQRPNQQNDIELQEVQRRQVDDGVAYGQFIDESRI